MNDALRIRLRKLDELSHALARREIQTVAWQRGAAQVCEGIDVQGQCRAGDFSSISDQKDNVHWFVTTSDRAYTLDAIVDNLEPSRPFRFQIDFVDPDHASRDSDGSIRMPRIELDECLRRYG